jgi:hypothetical protein
MEQTFGCLVYCGTSINLINGSLWGKMLYEKKCVVGKMEGLTALNNSETELTSNPWMPLFLRLTGIPMGMRTPLILIYTNFSANTIGEWSCIHPWPKNIGSRNFGQ